MKQLYNYAFLTILQYKGAKDLCQKLGKAGYLFPPIFFNITRFDHNCQKSRSRHTFAGILQDFDYAKMICFLTATFNSTIIYLRVEHRTPISLPLCSIKFLYYVLLMPSYHLLIGYHSYAFASSWSLIAVYSISYLLVTSPA